MKKFVFISFIPLFFLLFLPKALFCAQPWPKSDTGYVWVENLRVRKKPNLNAKVIDTLESGSTIQLLGDETKKKLRITLRGKEYFEPWYKIKTFKGKTGWIYGGGVKKNVFYFPESPHSLMVQFYKRSKNPESETTKPFPGCGISAGGVEFFKIGQVVAGEYEGGVLYRAGLECPEESKDPDDTCPSFFNIRYVKLKKTVTFFPKISTRLNCQSHIAKSLPGFFESLGYKFKTDPLATIPILEYPKIIRGPKEEQLLNFTYEGARQDYYDIDNYEKMFENRDLGAVFRDINISKYPPPNLFAVFRPDQTVLHYYYEPNPKKITFTDNNSAAPDESYYNYNYYGGYMRPTDPFINSFQIKSKTLKKKFNVIGKDGKGNFIYGPIGKEHEMLKEFYDEYVKSNRDIEGYYERGRKEKKLETYEAFIKQRPFYLWKGPFGRFHRFNNINLLPIYMAEPIVYLYPPKRQEILVTVFPKGGVEKSIPPYNDGWKIIAEKNGKLVNTADKKEYRYLFWEGISDPYPMQKKGFVVKKEEVGDFFRRILPRLGLIDQEITDFIKAWAPVLSKKPFCFITFLPESVIDDIAPIVIDPKPDTIIRVLMDYRPLDESISVVPLELDEPQERKGFTVVEWGGIRRYP